MHLQLMVVAETLEASLAVELWACMRSVEMEPGTVSEASPAERL